VKLSELRASWQEEHDRFLSDGALVNGARLVSRFLRDLNELNESTGRETLNLTEAARYSGYSREYLGRLVKDGKLRDYGRKGARKVRKAEVPIKPGHLPSEGSAPDIAGTSRGQVVRSIAKGNRQ